MSLRSRSPNLPTDYTGNRMALTPSFALPSLQNRAVITNNAHSENVDFSKLMVSPIQAIPSHIIAAGPGKDISIVTLPKVATEVPEISYADILPVLKTYRTHLRNLQDEKTNLTLILSCSQRLVSRKDNTITLGDKKLNLDYTHTQSEATTRMFTDKLKSLDLQICYVKNSIHALQEFRRHHISLDTIDDFFGMASEADIRHTIDCCELELKKMAETIRNTIDRYLLLKQYPNTIENIAKVTKEITNQTKVKWQVLGKLKEFLHKKEKPIVRLPKPVVNLLPPPTVTTTQRSTSPLRRQ